MRRLVGLIVSLAVVVTSHQAIGAEFIFDPASLRGSRDVGIGTLYLIGKITDGDYEHFVAAIKQWGPHPLGLNLRSEGGSVMEAMKIGRLVRQLSLSVYGPTATPQNLNSADCTYDAQRLGRHVPCICASACTLIFFAGVTRASLEIYIHSIAYEKDMFGPLSPMEADRLYKQAMQEVRVYLSEMDIDDKYYYMMTQTGSSDLKRVMTPIGGDLDFWAPAYREWLFAKCGNPPQRPITVASATAWGSCTVKTQSEAQVEAIKRIVLNMP